MNTSHSQLPFARGLSRQPSHAARAALLDPNDTVVLLIDHQTGLLQTVEDVHIAELRCKATTLAKAAQLANLPLFTTASEPNGPNGPLIEEFADAAPNARYIARQGEVSVWNNANFVAAVEATGRKTLVIAGVWTSVCVAFPALEAMADGYKVYFVTDASGDVSVMASCATLARLAGAGAIPVTTNVVVAELQRTWNRPDSAQWAELYQEAVPSYQAVVESHRHAQNPGPKQ